MRWMIMNHVPTINITMSSKRFLNDEKKWLYILAPSFPNSTWAGVVKTPIDSVFPTRNHRHYIFSQFASQIRTQKPMIIISNRANEKMPFENLEELFALF